MRREIRLHHSRASSVVGCSGAQAVGLSQHHSYGVAQRDEHLRFTLRQERLFSWRGHNYRCTVESTILSIVAFASFGVILRSLRGVQNTPSKLQMDKRRCCD